MGKRKNNKKKSGSFKKVIIVLCIAAAICIAALYALRRYFFVSRDVVITGDVEVIEYILTDSPNYKRSGKLAVRGLMLHSVGNPQPDAKTYADIFGEPDYTRSGVHAFIDAKTGEVYHTLPWNRVAWHCGGDGNLTHIGVEMCETDCEYYDEDGNLFITDPIQAKRDAKTAYNSAVKLFAILAEEYDLDPLKEGVIISHSEGWESGISSNHGDPEHYWEKVGLGYTMDGFRQDVYNRINK